MEEKSSSISVPPSTIQRVEGHYKPENPTLFKVYQQYKDLRDGYSENAKDISQVRLANNAFDPNYEARMIIQILEKMAVWMDTDEEFRREAFAMVLDFCRAQRVLLEDAVIEQILVLKEQYEYANGKVVEVEPPNDAVARIYSFVADSLAKLGVADLNEIPTSPGIKVPKKAAAV